MRAHQFIFEYRRDKTGQAMGDKLIATLANTRPHFVPDNLYNIHHVLSMVKNPKNYDDKTVLMDIFGTMTKINPQNAAEIVQQSKPQIIDAILAAIEARDPTPNKQYTQWLARTWINGGGASANAIEDMNRMNYLAMYDLAKRKGLVPADKADVNRFKLYTGDFEAWFHSSGIPERLRQEQEQAKLDAGKARKAYEDETATVVVPEDEAAACKYGRGTRWCTAATQGSNYFEHYSSKGPLYIILPKKPTYDGEKYQLHFPSGQYMDPEDDPVQLDVLYKKFPGVFDNYLLKIEPALKDSVQFADDDTLISIWQKIGEMVQEYVWEQISDWEANDDYYREWQEDEARKKGYVDQDGEVDWDRVYEDDKINDYYDFNDEARYIVKAIDYVYKMSPQQIRDITTETEDESSRDGLEVLEEVWIKAARKESFEAGDYVIRAMHKIAVRKRDGVWSVKRVKG